MALSEERVTRGRLLKRAGVGAAALGAGSMLTATTASANAPPSRACAEPGASGCSTCPAAAHPCPGGTGCCYCFITTEGCCFCAEDFFCDVPSCTSSSQCPPGWACVPNTCCGAGGVCAPHCGAITHHNFCGPSGPKAIGARSGARR
jgi:hypothetical protein